MHWVRAPNRRVADVEAALQGWQVEPGERNPVDDDHVAIVAAQFMCTDGGSPFDVDLIGEDNDK